ncbi:MAG: hypothetical protein KBA31_17515 [Alphaproteobacteria bacterium]|nr:hypothetical protein [Alphaproteobacteria bacterium]
MRQIILIVAITLSTLSFSLNSHAADGLPFERLSEEQRVSDLRFLAAQITTQHPAPFHRNSADTWKRRVSELESNLASLDASGFFFRLQSIAALADDIHTSVFPISDHGILTTTYPIRLGHFEGGVFIRAARQDHAAILNAQVLQINGIDVGEVVRRATDVSPGNSRLARSNAPLAYLLTPDFYKYIGSSSGGADASFTVRDVSGAIKTATLKPENVSLLTAYESGSVTGWSMPQGWVSSIGVALNPAVPLYGQRDRMAILMPMPDRQTLVIQINQPQPDERNTIMYFLSDLLKHVADHKYKKVVVDLRGNEGGWYSLTQPLAGLLSTLELAKGVEQICVLIGRDTASAGVVLAAQIEMQTNAIFIGEETGSGPNFYGTYKPRALPNSGFFFRISKERIVTSLPADSRTSIHPDLYVIESLQSLAAGRDKALEVALSLAPTAQNPFPWYERWSRPSQRIRTQ